MTGQHDRPQMASDVWRLEATGSRSQKREKTVPKNLCSRVTEENTSNIYLYLYEIREAVRTKTVRRTRVKMSGRFG